MKILVVGGGGREHAIIRALKKSSRCSEIWCAPGNGGISYDAHCKAIPATDVDAMVKFAKEEAFDYVVVAQVRWKHSASTMRCFRLFWYFPVNSRTFGNSFAKNIIFRWNILWQMAARPVFIR